MEIPEGVTSIGDEAFEQCGSNQWSGYYACSNFVSVKLPSTLQISWKNGIFIGVML